MGGGGVIRTVGKVAGIVAAASRCLRGVQPAPAEHSAPGVSCNVAAIVSSKSGTVSAGDVSAVAVQRPAWEIDDCELAGGEGDLVMSSGEPIPRVVFGAAPSFQEAKAVTDELKDAIEKMYLLSPVAADSGSSILLAHPFDQPLWSDSEAESKHLVFTAEPAPKHAFLAVKMLTQSPAVQNVVASIASDPNVRNAFLQSEAVMDFVQKQISTSVEFPSEDLNMKSWGEDGVPQDVISDSKSGNSENGFMNILQNGKHAVEDTVNKVSGFFQNIFSPKAEEKANTVGAGDGRSTFMDATLGPSFFGLAVLAILVVFLRRDLMVVLLKRGLASSFRPI